MLVCWETMEDIIRGGNGFGVFQIGVPLKILIVITFRRSQRNRVGSTETNWKDAWRFFMIAKPNANNGIRIVFNNILIKKKFLPVRSSHIGIIRIYPYHYISKL